MKGSAQWETIKATHYRKNNEVDRVAEIKDVFDSSADTELIEAVAVGSIVYCLTRRKHANECGMVVIQTTASSFKGDRWFSFCIFDESEALLLEHADTCPKRLLSELPQSGNQQAADWRKRCMMRAARNAECKRLQRTGFKRVT